MHEPEDHPEESILYYVSFFYKGVPGGCCVQRRTPFCTINDFARLLEIVKEHVVSKEGDCEVDSITIIQWQRFESALDVHGAN